MEIIQVLFWGLLLVTFHYVVKIYFKGEKKMTNERLAAEAKYRTVRV